MHFCTNKSTPYTNSVMSMATESADTSKTLPQATHRSLPVHLLHNRTAQRKANCFVNIWNTIAQITYGDGSNFVLIFGTEPQFTDTYWYGDGCGQKQLPTFNYTAITQHLQTEINRNHRTESPTFRFLVQQLGKNIQHTCSNLKDKPLFQQVGHFSIMLVSDIAIFVLKRDVKLQLTNSALWYSQLRATLNWVLGLYMAASPFRKFCAMYNNTALNHN